MVAGQFKKNTQKWRSGKGRLLYTILKIIAVVQLLLLVG